MRPSGSVAVFAGTIVALMTGVSTIAGTASSPACTLEAILHDAPRASTADEAVRRIGTSVGSNHASGRTTAQIERDAILAQAAASASLSKPSAGETRYVASDAAGNQIAAFTVEQTASGWAVTGFELVLSGSICEALRDA